MLEPSLAFSAINQVPGPGTYAPEKSMQLYKEKKGFSMASKNEEKPSRGTPGPGTY